jgi:hypothetical protein
MQEQINAALSLQPLQDLIFHNLDQTEIPLILIQDNHSHKPHKQPVNKELTTAVSAPIIQEVRLPIHPLLKILHQEAPILPQIIIAVADIHPQVVLPQTEAAVVAVLLQADPTVVQGEAVQEVQDINFIITRKL